MQYCSAFDLSDSGRDDLLSLPFFSSGNPLDKNRPRCFLSTAAAGSLRFRWNEENPRRKNFFLEQHVLHPRTGANVCVPADCDSLSSADIPVAAAARDLATISSAGLYPAVAGSWRLGVPLELVHSKVVFAVDRDEKGLPRLAARSGSHPDAVDLWRGDGLITDCGVLVPVVTVADCLPIYLYEPKTGCRGVVHSGWKGTGIAAEAIRLAEQVYGAAAEDFSVVIGPHIQSCCYQVDGERLRYFTENFGSSCILPPDRLSLAQANVTLLLELGVKEDNILCCTDCSCCDSRLGSFRRQTAHLPQTMPLTEKLRRFTTMAAYVG